MTPPVVLDASVGIPLVVEQDVSRLARRSVTSWLDEGAQLLVPAHFWLEVVNSLARRHGLASRSVVEALFELDQLAISTVEADRPTLLAAVDGMERWGLSAYDAVYLAVAHAAGARLATFDRALASAAGPDAIDLAGQVGGSAIAEGRERYGSAKERAVSWPAWSGIGGYLASLRSAAAAPSDTAVGGTAGRT